jgi:hypothetical protein
MRGMGRRTKRMEKEPRTAVMITRAMREGCIMTETARPKRVLDE